MGNFLPMFTCLCFRRPYKPLTAASGRVGRCLPTPIVFELVEKKMQTSIQSLGLGFRDITSIMPNRMEKNMKNDVETGSM